MQIFILDKDPQKAALYHNNKHVVKMCVESAQILCTIHHITGNRKDSGIYELTVRVRSTSHTKLTSVSLKYTPADNVNAIFFTSNPLLCYLIFILFNTCQQYQYYMRVYLNHPLSFYFFLM